MKQEESLSEKRVQSFIATQLEKGYHYSYNEEDVKEAVRKLKEELNRFNWGVYTKSIIDWNNRTIDKIFGDKLK